MTAEPPHLDRPDDFEGPAIELGNEFAEVRIRKVRTRNGGDRKSVV